MPPRAALSLPSLIVLVICVSVTGITALLQITGTFSAAQRYAVAYGGFWPQLLQGVQGFFPQQPVTMFITHGLIHAGWLHLGMNMMALVVFDRELRRIASPGSIALIYAASQICGALAYGLLSHEVVPMVGASGAIFGLAGASISMVARMLRRQGRSLRPLAGPLIQFVLLNLVLTFLIPSIAWQAHLGGAAAGLILGPVLLARPPAR